jgi:alpha-tubulin suppressor-like RCC1 family protein
MGPLPEAHRLEMCSVSARAGVVAVSAGSGHSLALRSDGAVLAWGNNWDGQLGDGTTTTRMSPVAVVGLGPGSGVVAIDAAQSSFSLALKSDGTVLAWGMNSTGELGDGTTRTSLTPIEVSGLGPGSGVIAISAGASYSLALKKNGSVVSWGLNHRGQLGDGTTVLRRAPVPVHGLGPGSGVSAVSASGGFWSLTLKSDGTVLSWGNNDSGQLGDGTTSSRSVPRPVSGFGVGSGVVSVAAGGLHGLALKRNGAVLAWGENSGGQLGDGTHSSRGIPGPVASLGSGSTAVGLSAGFVHSLVLQSGGTVLAWGRNVSGQLGTGTTSDAASPVVVSGLGPNSGIGLLSAGGAHSLALADLQYAALGDSFSSGEGTPPFIAETDQPGVNMCHRSSAGYPYKVVLGSGHRLQHEACSGAVAADLVNDSFSGYRGEYAQLNALAEQARLVTLTIGGNDVGFGPVVSVCVWVNDCSGTQGVVSFVDNAIDALALGHPSYCVELQSGLYGASQRHCFPATPRLRDLYLQTRSKAPFASLVVSGYPYLFTQTPGRFGCTFGLSPIGPVQLSRAEVNWVNAKADALNDAIVREISAANRLGADIRFADPRSSFQHHGLCDSDPWINGLRWNSDGASPESLHPNVQGQDAYKATVQSAISRRR